MTLTPECRRLLDRFDQLGVKPYDQMTVLEARASVAAGTRLQGEPPEVASVTDLLAPGGAGRVPVRMYHPDPGAELPLIVYFHGGGFVTGSVDVADTACRALALGTRCAVASVDYRLSPETPFPGALEDCFAATEWLAQTAGFAQLVVMGDSAGGNLAAVVALMARDHGGPTLAAQVLLYPTLAAARGNVSSSYQQNAEGYGLTRGGLEWFWDHYLTSAEQGLQPYASPLRAVDLHGLPPALVVTAEHDPLRDEGRDYAARLVADCVPTQSHDYPGLVHGFFWMAKILPEARDVVARIDGFLNDALGRQHIS